MKNNLWNSKFFHRKLLVLLAGKKQAYFKNKRVYICMWEKYSLLCEQN